MITTLRRHFPFLVTLLLVACGWVLVTLLTWDAPARDASRLYGFPLPFGFEGGMCANGKCPFSYNIYFLTADLLAILLLPVLVEWVIKHWRKPKSLSR